jgi:hypothetical protein
MSASECLYMKQTQNPTRAPANHQQRKRDTFKQMKSPRHTTSSKWRPIFFVLGGLQRLFDRLVCQPVTQGRVRFPHALTKASLPHWGFPLFVMVTWSPLHDMRQWSVTHYRGLLLCVLYLEFSWFCTVKNSKIHPGSLGKSGVRGGGVDKKSVIKKSLLKMCENGVSGGVG